MAKISALSALAAASITATDLTVVVDDLSGTPTTYKATMADVRSALLGASGSGWTATDYLGLGGGTIPSSGMIRVGQGTITANAPLIHSTATWNDAGVTFTHILVELTDTASNAGSAIADWKVGGSSMWKVTKGGAVTQAGALTVAAGGITVTGNSSITGTLDGITTLTATTVAGTLATAAQPNITSVGTLTSLAAGAITSTGLLTVTLTTQQLALRYDGSNHLAVTVGATGAVTFNATGAGAAFTFSDAVTLSSTLGVTGTATFSTALADSNLATIATAGKVSNSATTAASANTASAIVARDGSGNFAAGTITAALTGNASTATALQNARTLWGVSFDGTANVTAAPTFGAGATVSSGQTLTLTGATITGAPTWGSTQTLNTSGTASNITAYTINQNVGSGNSPTFAGLALAGHLTFGSDNAYNVGAGGARAANMYAVTFHGALSGNATTSSSTTGNAATVTNGVYTTGSYADPAWITSLAGTKISGNISGNAATATTLQTARDINGVSFNGSASITVTAAAGTLSGATIAAGVTASSLTSVGATLAIGATPATTGTLRLPTGATIYTRNAANSADLAQVTFTDAQTAAFTGSVQVGVNLTVGATNKIIMGADSDTYIWESSANTITFYSAGVNGFNMFWNGSAMDYQLVNHGTSASAATMYIDTNGLCYRSTSSLRYKQAVAPLPLADARRLVLGSVPVQFRGTGREAERQFVGLVAEWMDNIDPRVVMHDAQGRPDNVEYAHLVAPLMLVAQDHETRIARLEAVRQ